MTNEAIEILNQHKAGIGAVISGVIGASLLIKLFVTNKAAFLGDCYEAPDLSMTSLEEKILFGVGLAAVFLAIIGGIYETCKYAEYVNKVAQPEVKIKMDHGYIGVINDEIVNKVSQPEVKIKMDHGYIGVNHGAMKYLSKDKFAERLKSFMEEGEIKKIAKITIYSDAEASNGYIFNIIRDGNGEGFKLQYFGPKTSDNKTGSPIAEFHYKNYESFANQLKNGVALKSDEPGKILSKPDLQNEEQIKKD